MFPGLPILSEHSLSIHFFNLDKDDSVGKFLGLDHAIFIAIVLSAASFILIIVIAVCLRSRKFHRGKVIINRKGIALREQDGEEVHLEMMDRAILNRK